MKTIFICSFFLSVNLLIAQTAPEIEWQNTIGGSDYDFLNSVQQTSDGGYIVSGYSDSGISGDKNENQVGGTGDVDYWVVKLDSAGAIEWQNTIGSSGNDYLRAIQQTVDGGFILGGSAYEGISGDKDEPTFGGPDYWVLKLNSSGTIQWQNTIGGNGDDYLSSIKQTSDGGYILGGSSSSGISGDKTEARIGFYDYWVVKLDSSGAIEWQNTIGGNSYDHLFCIQQTIEGGYILGGYSDSKISGDKTEDRLDTTSPFTDDYWIVKLDQNGIIEWQNTIGGDDDDFLYSVQPTSDGGYILGGSSQSDISGDKTESNQGPSYTFDYWTVKIDSYGVIEWQNTIGGDNDDKLYSVQQTADGSFILGGSSQSDISGDKTEDSFGGAFEGDFWVVKLNSNGTINWQNTIGGSEDDPLSTIQQTSDGGYILGGYSYSGISGDKTEPNLGTGTFSSVDYWVVKLYPEDNICAAVSSVNSFPFATHAGLMWNEVEGAVKYRVRYKPIGTVVWKYKNVSGGKNHLGIKSLVCNTDYEWQVNTICATDGSISSGYSASSFFTTAACRLGDINKNSILNIYPNPAQNKFTIHAQINYAAKISIYNSFGQLIYTKEINATDGFINETIDLQNISSGIYFVTVNSEENYFEEKLIIE